MDRRRNQAVLALAVALGLVCGCQRAAREPTPMRIPPGLQTRFFPPPGWTWAHLSVPGAPPIRYGVGAPARAVKGVVVIVPGFAEPAETWFETASELIAEGYGVWLLDLAGQGGSGRWSEPRDKAHLPSMAPNLAAVKVLVAEVIRPAPGAALVAMGSGLGAQVVLRAAAAGLPELDGVVLSAPSLSDWPLPSARPPAPPVLAQGVRLVGLGEQFAAGQSGWSAAGSRRDAPNSRAATAQAWMRANPDLRTGGVTWGWISAYDASLAATRSRTTLRAVSVPVLMLEGAGDDGRETCAAMPACRYQRLPPGTAPHLAQDAVREPWRRALQGFIAERSVGYSPAAVPVRTATAP